jgi:CMP/dCMP kinase
VLESRLAGWIARNEKVAATTVWIACDEWERAQRVGRRDGVAVDVALAANRAREASEVTRYARYYGIDLLDLTPYELCLDSTTSPPPELAAAVLDRVG